MYQYPKSDNFHFYVDENIRLDKFEKSINILNRIIFISTVGVGANAPVEEMYQYPKSDNFHFYNGKTVR